MTIFPHNSQYQCGPQGTAAISQHFLGVVCKLHGVEPQSSRTFLAAKFAQFGAPSARQFDRGGVAPCTRASHRSPHTEEAKLFSPLCLTGNRQSCSPSSLQFWCHTRGLAQTPASGIRGYSSLSGPWHHIPRCLPPHRHRAYHTRGNHQIGSVALQLFTRFQRLASQKQAPGGRHHHPRSGGRHSNQQQQNSSFTAAAA